MDFLNNAGTQVRDLFLSMTVSARIVAALLLAVVVLSVVFLFRQGTTGPDAYLFGAEYLPASDLNRIESAIAVRGLSGYTREGNRIRVPANQKAEYLAAVADADALPRNFHDLLDGALDKGGVWESREMTRQRLRIAKAQTLSEILRAMPWVEDAVVIYDEQDANGLNRTKQVVGSVNIMPIPGEALTYERRKTLQNAVAHAVLGLKPDAVAVTSLGDDSSFGGAGLSPEAFENDYLRARAMFNQYQREAILQVVSYIPGVRVQVNAELDNISEDVLHNIKPDDKPQLLREEFTKDSTERSMANAGARPGLEAQGPYRQQVDLTAKADSDKTKSESGETQNFVGYADQQIRKAGYVPKTVWATVAVPKIHLVDIWRQRNATAGQATEKPNENDLLPIEDEIRKKIENLVQPLLPGHIAGEDSYKYVTVEFVESKSPVALPEPSFAQTAMAWSGRNWGGISMVFLAGFSLLMLRSIAKGVPGTPQGAGPQLKLEDSSQEAAAVVVENEEQAEDADRPRLKLKKSGSLKDDLVNIVREDPDAAADILRNWIGNAA